MLALLVVVSINQSCRSRTLAHHHPLHVATKGFRDFETLLNTAISHAVVPLFGPPYEAVDHDFKL